MSHLIVPPPLPQPWALYEGELTGSSGNALTANGVYLVLVVALVPMALTGVRCRFAGGGAGHYDTGIYDANGNLLAHGASSATALATATGVQTPTFTSGNLSIPAGRYYLALWVDNATDTVARDGGNANFVLCKTGTYAGPLPAAASSITGLADAAVKPILIGILSGGFS